MRKSGSASALSAKQVMWAALTVLVALVIVMPVLRATDETGDFKIGDGLNPAADSNGSTINVVVWEADNGSDIDIVGKRLDLQGNSVGDELEINTTTAGDQRNPDVAMLSTGGFVVVWESDATGTSEVIAQRFGEFGEPVGIEIRVNALATAAVAPAVGADNQGNFIVAWAGKENVPGSRPQDYRHRVRRFNGLGVALENERVLGSKGLPTPPTLAVKTSGAHLVAWEDHQKNIAGMAFDALGAPLSGLFRVNPSLTGQHAAPSVEVAADGDYTLAWRKKAAFENSISVRRISAFGEPVGIEIRVNQTAIDRHATPQVAADDNSNVVIVWQGKSDSENESAVFARLIEIDGEPVGIELRVNSTTSGLARAADVTPETANSFFVVWENDDMPVEDPDILANCIEVVPE